MDFIKIKIRCPQGISSKKLLRLRSNMFKNIKARCSGKGRTTERDKTSVVDKSWGGGRKISEVHRTWGAVKILHMIP